MRASLPEAVGGIERLVFKFKKLLTKPGQRTHSAPRFDHASSRDQNVIAEATIVPISVLMLPRYSSTWRAQVAIVKFECAFGDILMIAKRAVHYNRVARYPAPEARCVSCIMR